MNGNNTIVKTNENYNYEKMQRENLKQKRNSPYETTNYKTVKEFFLKSINL